MNPPTACDSEIYGAFRLGPMSLALPMAVLLEVVPCTNLQPLPSAVPWVMGGLDLRGVLVPVVDLSILLHKPGEENDRQCVVIVAHEGRLAGIAATSVDCLFSISTQQINRFHSQDPVGRLARGSLQNPVSGNLLTLLCAESLMALPQLPAVADPKPNHQKQVIDQEKDRPGDPGRIPLLLMRTRGLLFAVNPRDIETTMPRAQLQAKDVCNGYYKGNAIYREREIPAVDLIEYLDIGKSERLSIQSASTVQPAFVLRFEQGAMAVLIDEILDIVQVDPRNLIDLPPVPALQTHLLGQTIAVQSIYPEQNHDEHYYVIRPQGMVADPRLSELTALVHKAESAKNAAADSEHARNTQHKVATDQRVIVFEMHGDHAIPIGEIAEVLPYRGVKEAFSRDNPFLGIMTHRNRAIPVVDLAQHMGLRRQQLNTSSNVLVVQLDNQPIGLAVGCLRSIEQANWTPEVPVLGAARTERSGVLRESQKLAEVVIGNERKLLEVISGLEEAQRFVRNSGTLIRHENLNPTGVSKPEQVNTAAVDVEGAAIQPAEA